MAETNNTHPNRSLRAAIGIAGLAATALVALQFSDGEPSVPSKSVTVETGVHPGVTTPPILAPGASASEVMGPIPEDVIAEIIKP